MMSSVTQVDTTTEIQEVKSLRLTCTSGNDLSKPTHNTQTEHIPDSIENHVCGDCSDEGSCVDCGKLSSDSESNENNSRKESKTSNMSKASKECTHKTKTDNACNAFDEDNAANNNKATNFKNKNLQPRYKANVGQNQNVNDNCDSPKKKTNTNNAPSSSCKKNVSEDVVDNSVRAARQESIIDTDGCHNENDARSSDTVKIPGDNHVENNEVSMDYAESLPRNSLEIGATCYAPNPIQNEEMVRIQMSQNEDKFQPMSNTLDLEDSPRQETNRSDLQREEEAETEVKVLLQKLGNATVEDRTNSVLEADAAAVTNAVMLDTRRIREGETERFRNEIEIEGRRIVKDVKEELKAEGAAYKKEMSDEMDLSTKLEFTRNSM